ncbi:hypothetical protein OG250_03170 [Streptomyces sp. NBC_00487]|uniref:hypothetical protein n=1 Tax=unclassified Streptomyces TaxID=2593676 RepID=UPI002E17F894|nr:MULTISPECIES: hypothetical protein [unclassified Streptomyces]
MSEFTYAGKSFIFHVDNGVVFRNTYAADGTTLRYATLEGPAKGAEARGMEVVGDVLRDEALAVFRNYRKAVDSADGIVVYNARGGAERQP